MIQPVSSSRSIARRRVGVWLAVCALVIQSLLPLLDAPLHRAATPGSVSMAAAATTTGHQPGHTTHDCAVCQFMASLGSFTPPQPARVAPPVDVAGVVAPPAARPVTRAHLTLAAQPRAPPRLI